MRRLRFKSPPPLRLTSPPVPNASILHCPLCGLEVHRYLMADVRPLGDIYAEAEEAARTHLRAHHPGRWAGWRMFGWRGLIRDKPR